MENWKRAVIAGSVGTATMLLFLDLAMKLGSRIEELVEKRAAQAFEELGEY